jgi:hypothetical protein
MNDRLDALLGQIRHLEKELILEAHKKETEFSYEESTKRWARSSASSKGGASARWW